MSLLQLLEGEPPAGDQVTRYITRDGGFNYHLFIQDLTIEDEYCHELETPVLYAMTRKLGNPDYRKDASRYLDQALSHRRVA